jgi:hypothetical protein
MRITRTSLSILTAALITSCYTYDDRIANHVTPPINTIIVDSPAKTIATRFYTPSGYERIPFNQHTFQSYLSNFPLQPINAKVYYYNGMQKPVTNTYASVLKIDVGNKDLQQCADAVIRLRAEYLYAQQRYDEIQFHFTNGFPASYKKWAEGSRIRIAGNHTSWYAATSKDYSYKTFRQYLDILFSYAGTKSLSKELKLVSINHIQPGDVFIQGGSPGHAVIVVDVAQHKRSGKRIFMIAQSYMPAQSIHILVNLNDRELSPWYEVGESDKLYTPEWVFERGDLKRF